MIVDAYASDTSGPGEVLVFGTLDEVCTMSLLIQDKTNDRGKMLDVFSSLGAARCNGCETFDFSGIDGAPEDSVLDDELRQRVRDMRLARILETDAQDGLRRCLACPRFARHWANLGAFHRLSYLKDADHACQKYRLLYLFGVRVNADATVADLSREYAGLSLEAKEALRQVAHVRWSRFYYLNGWTHADGPMDPRARTHPQLVDYQELSDESNRSMYDNGYLNVCQLSRTEELQKWLDAVWLGNEDEGSDPLSDISLHAVATEAVGDHGTRALRRGPGAAKRPDGRG